MPISKLTGRLAMILLFLATFTATTLFTETAEAKPPQVRVTTQLLNVRSGPGTGYAVVTTVSRGAVLNVLDRKRGWLLVKYPGGNQSGWISQAYVTRVR